MSDKPYSWDAPRICGGSRITVEGLGYDLMVTQTPAEIRALMREVDPDELMELSTAEGLATFVKPGRIVAMTPTYKPVE